ncbi:Pre-rRNA-processing protein IPI1 [Escovopsis weberi]|uniref:Pre-rRNA-processing protein n=1 Tax=Escovopsis weberi TaxID=150374 RepID=A0A0M9VUI6_ESCWE|nr:Pre-rRNA-processing protein IPI1 [Escovopsis weberi]
MGSSTKKKKEKAKDFQKPKFKVGKAKPKASNFTDTSFKSKDVIQQFKHNLSLASSSKSDKQRRDALAYLTGQLSSTPPVNPVGTSALLLRLLPLISDSSTPVRSQLLKLLRALPADEATPSVERAAMYIRAGMTHLSSDISSDALGVMEWLLDVAGDELVACPGGWVKTLSTFCVAMGWAASSSAAGWTSVGRTGGIKAKDAQTLSRQISVLSRFLQTGFRPETAAAPNHTQYWDNLYRAPRSASAFEYLNLFSVRRDEEGQMYPDREARQQIFHRRFLEPISKGVDKAKKEGGPTGRAAVALDQVLKKGMNDYQASTALDAQDLLDLW